MHGLCVRQVYRQTRNLTRVFADVAVYNPRIMSMAHVENVAELGYAIDVGLMRDSRWTFAALRPLLRPAEDRACREQAVHFAEALARGEPNGLEIIRTALATRIRELELTRMSRSA